MALKEYYIGTVGPLFMEDTDPLYSDPGQKATKGDLEDSLLDRSENTVVSETTYGQASAVGISDKFSRGDHTHGTPAAPDLSGYITEAPNDGKIYVRRNNAWEELVIT